MSLTTEVSVRTVIWKSTIWPFSTTATRFSSGSVALTRICWLRSTAGARGSSGSSSVSSAPASPRRRRPRRRRPPPASRPPGPGCASVSGTESGARSRRTGRPSRSSSSPGIVSTKTGAGAADRPLSGRGPSAAWRLRLRPPREPRRRRFLGSKPPGAGSPAGSKRAGRSRGGASPGPSGSEPSSSASSPGIRSMPISRGSAELET